MAREALSWKMWGTMSGGKLLDWLGVYLSSHYTRVLQYDHWEAGCQCLGARAAAARPGCARNDSLCFTISLNATKFGKFWLSPFFIA